MDLIYIKRMYRNRIIILVSIIIAFFMLVTFIAVGSITKVTSVSVNLEQSEFSNSDLSSDEENKIITAVVEEKEKLPKLTNKGKENISNIYKSKTKRAFLTFDDGPSKTITIPILDLLKKENIKATFFVLGSRVELYPSIVKREYEEGHFIANHGYSHIYSQIYSSVDSVLDEYNKTNKAVSKAIGVKKYNSHLFRFPGGSVGGKYSDLKKAAISRLDENNIAYVDWNALTGDAEGKKDSEQQMSYLQETMEEKNSLIILMHDAGDKQVTYETLPSIINLLREKGYEFKNFYDIMK